MPRSEVHVVSGKRCSRDIPSIGLKSAPRSRTSTSAASARVPGAILRETLYKHPDDVSDPISRNTPVDDVYQLYCDIVEYHFTMILDEADNIHDHDVIERLHAVLRLSIVAICHDQQSWLAQVPMVDSHSFNRDRHIQMR